SDCYCHFTSPIRRYPDLTIHRMVDALLLKRKPKDDYDALVLLGEHCSNRERRAEAAERELTKVKLLNYLSERIGDELDAVITGVEEFGLFAQGIALPAEGLIHVSSLSDDFYHYERKSHTLTGRRSGNAFRLGDRVRVTVASVDVDRRALDFRIVRRDARADGAVTAQPAKERKATRKPAAKRAGKQGAVRRAKKTSRRKHRG
ncbi:MAG: S1 RNA-binding domain-containing protein, partial [Planctomycetes bacterium]|nr:S1 RNA-binding domain-containing protein [Planctomycetota bacterium]